MAFRRESGTGRGRYGQRRSAASGGCSGRSQFQLVNCALVHSSNSLEPLQAFAVTTLFCGDSGESRGTSPVAIGLCCFCTGRRTYTSCYPAMKKQRARLTPHPTIFTRVCSTATAETATFNSDRASRVCKLRAMRRLDRQHEPPSNSTVSTIYDSCSFTMASAEVLRHSLPSGLTPP